MPAVPPSPHGREGMIESTWLTILGVGISVVRGVRPPLIAPGDGSARSPRLAVTQLENVTASGLEAAQKTDPGSRSAAGPGVCTGPEQGSRVQKP